MRIVGFLSVLALACSSESTPSNSDADSGAVTPRGGAGGTAAASGVGSGEGGSGAGSGGSVAGAPNTDSGTADAAPVDSGSGGTDSGDIDAEDATAQLACDLPEDAGASVIDCSGLCGEPNCVDPCSMYPGDPEAYRLFHAGGCGQFHIEGCKFGYEGYGFPVPDGKCAKVSAQPGAAITLGIGTCLDAVPDCIVSSTDNIRMVGPDIDAWVHYESADLIGDTCPLSCP